MCYSHCSKENSDKQPECRDEQEEPAVNERALDSGLSHLHSVFAAGGSDNPVVRVGLCEGAGTRVASQDVPAGIQIQGIGER